ncbi:hypothetical protein DFJ63DRAFT_218977 [Scheffersomyces coipomensis]|uniref:uncharacterized protein n=1 Tax=Scheffersomyces coipomensis TaxID=1788519 RepID=UPI00315DBA56
MSSYIEETPIWQEDSEVTCCFLCHSIYTFFNRRHHCRKCGRVVCGNCSEKTVKYFPNTLVVHQNGSKTIYNPYETYKTCDECVDEIKMIRKALFDANPSSSTIEESEYPSRTSSANSSTSSLTPTNALNIANPFLHRPDHGGHNHNQSHDNDNDSTTKYSTRTHTRLIRSSTHSSFNHSRHSRHRGGNNRDGDDESDANLCPVCATDLLKSYINHHKKHIEEISNDDFEKFKETHINDCLTDFDFNTENQRFNSPDKPHPRNKMLVYNIPPFPKPKFESIPNLEAASSMDTIRQSESRQDDETLSPYQSPSPSPSPISNVLDVVVGSVLSNATMEPSAEKDKGYLEDDGLDNECVICLEDLKPGDKVGRLECLCVFHYACIKDWFNKKGYGECPVHFLHK